MDRETGPFGLKKQFTYQEVLRAIQQQPYDIPVPARVGLRTWDDPFYQNMIQDQASYQGDVAKSGFSHEAPFQPPPRDEVFYDAWSDEDPYSGSGGGEVGVVVVVRAGDATAVAATRLAMTVVIVMAVVTIVCRL